MYAVVEAICISAAVLWRIIVSKKYKKLYKVMQGNTLGLATSR